MNLHPCSYIRDHIAEINTLRGDRYLQVSEILVNYRSLIPDPLLTIYEDRYGE